MAPLPGASGADAGVAVVIDNALVMLHAAGSITSTKSVFFSFFSIYFFLCI